MINIIRYKTLWLTIAGILVVASIAFLAIWGLKLGIDFTGGSLLEIEFVGDRPTVADLTSELISLGVSDVSVQPFGDKGMILRFKSIDEVKHQEVLKSFGEKFGEIEENRFESIGPTIGKELRSKAIYTIVIVLVCIIAYIAWAFRKVSKPVASWKYGLIAIVVLAHDVLLPIGLFVVLGKFLGIEVKSVFVAAILTILGYSVNDTIIVFDRVRENLIKAGGGYENFEGIVNQSVNQTLTRSINTTLTTLLVLFAVFFWGGETIKYFALALIVGIALGTYSSIFIASPLLVVLEKFRRR